MGREQNGGRKGVGEGGPNDSFARPEFRSRRTGTLATQARDNVSSAIQLTPRVSSNILHSVRVVFLTLVSVFGYPHETLSLLFHIPGIYYLTFDSNTNTIQVCFLLSDARYV